MEHTIGFDDTERLSRLRAATKAARQQGWSPYSGYGVMAAVETADGRYYGGANVENANYTLTVHAEHSAVLAALADGARQRCGRAFITAIYVASASEGAPCGGCRQVVNEFAHPDCLWVADDLRDRVVRSAPFERLLPLGFGPAHLGITD